MEYANLIIVNTREKIIDVLKDSRLPAMVAKMILGELITIVEKEADVAISMEHKEYIAKMDKSNEIPSEENIQ